MVKAKIVEVYKDEFNDDLPIYLNLEKKYPANPMSVVVYWKDVKKVNPNIFSLLNKTVLINGTVFLIKHNEGKTPCIKVSRKSQITVIK